MSRLFANHADRMKFAAALSIAAALMISATPRLRAQEVAVAEVDGKVTDPTGAAIAGATVTVKNLDTGYTRLVNAGANGLYIAPDLPIGTYAVSSQSQGFAPLTQTGIHLGPGSDTVIDEQLKPGSTATEVQVTGESWARCRISSE